MRGTRVAAAFALAGLCLLAGCGRGRDGAPSRQGFIGTVLEQTRPAPDLTLTDQDGARFRMAGIRGKVVLLTFLYTHCTDTCPFLALKIRRTAELLGADAAKVAFVAVTTDPQRDTPAVTAAYSRAAGLEGTWTFLTGPLDELRAVWASYGISVQGEEKAGAAAGEESAKPATGDEDPSQGLDAGALTSAGQIIHAFGGGYEVSHTAPFFLIDRRGTMRVIMDAAVLPSDIVKNIRLLM